MSSHQVFRAPAPSQDGTPYNMVGARGWTLVGRLEVTDTLEHADFYGEAGIDGLWDTIFLIEDIELAQFSYAGKQLSFLDSETPLAPQIQAMNEDEARRDFSFIEYDAPLYAVRRGVDPEPENYRNHPFYVYPSPAEGPLKCSACFTNAPGWPIAKVINKSVRLRSFLEKCLPDKPALDSLLCCLSDDEGMGGPPLNVMAELRPQCDQLGTVFLNAPLFLIPPRVASMLMTAPSGDELDEFDSVARALPSTPVRRVENNCRKIVPTPLLLLPDFGFDRQRIDALYCYAFNHNYVHDLAQACLASAGEDALPNSYEQVGSMQTLRLIEQHTTSYLNFFNMAFVQDRFFIGCQRDGDGWKMVQLNCPHKTAALPPSSPIKTVPLPGSSTVEQNYGGNFVVSPPVLSVTHQIMPLRGIMGECGPAVPNQPKAVFGKIIVGDCSRGYQRRLVDDGLRTGLWQNGGGAQPWLPIDVSWLAVGHVDEVVSFISVDRHSHKMVLPSTKVMRHLLALLAEEDRHGLCKFHVGQWGRIKNTGKFATREQVGPGGSTSYDEIPLRELQLAAYAETNRRIQVCKLDPIKRRLCTGLAIEERDIIELPVYFSMDGLAPKLANAKTANVVNMQMINGHCLIARPFAPRVTPACAGRILSRLLPDAPGVPECTGFWHWVFPGENVLRLAIYYLPHKIHGYSSEEGLWRKQMLDRPWDDPGPILAALSRDPLLALAQKFWYEIASHDNNGMPADLTQMMIVEEWIKIWIPLPLVDIVEAYICSAFAQHGVTAERIHFIDSWAYHKKEGNVHCGTNAMGSPPAAWHAQVIEWEEKPDFLKNITDNPYLP